MRMTHTIGGVLFTIAAVLLVTAGIIDHDLGMVGGGLCALMLAVETWRRRPRGPR